jgi:hypothetical protein
LISRFPDIIITTTTSIITTSCSIVIIAIVSIRRYLTITSSPPKSLHSNYKNNQPSKLLQIVTFLQELNKRVNTAYSYLRNTDFL